MPSLLVTFSLSESLHADNLLKAFTLLHVEQTSFICFWSGAAGCHQHFSS